MALADKPLPSFFFYSSGAPRDPHSFPTRRSSDLIAVLVGQPRPLAAAHEHRLGKPSGAGCAGTRADASHQVPGGDRKSTRLNSSHVEISYAVFCLKKKNAAIATRRDAGQAVNVLG